MTKIMTTIIAFELMPIVNETNVETQGSGSIYKTRFNFIRLADT